MPMYSWKCESCSTVTEVIRSIKDIDNGPDEGCEACRGKDLKRVIPEFKREQVSLVWGGQAPWHSEGYGPRGPTRDK